MPEFPWAWRSAPAPTSECTVMASRLPVRGYRHLPVFLQRSLIIRRQLASAPGLIGFALLADLLHKTFWTVSAWDSRRSLTGFSMTNPHRIIARATKPMTGASTFVFWTCPVAELPVSWDEVRRRVIRARTVAAPARIRVRDPGT
jgi:heme-degrading monooxygenase HmoA